MGESNSRYQFGKLELYHLTNPAGGAYIATWYQKNKNPASSPFAD